MSIKRTPRPKSHYTVIANAVLRDENLSFRARGVLGSILSRPDNWKTTAESLARESKEGRAAILTTLKELENVGYLVRNKYQNEKGQWVWESNIYDTPQTIVQKPYYGKPTSDEPTSENRTLIEVTIKNELKEVTKDHRTYGDDDIRLANLLAELIVANGSKPPTVTTKWYSDIEKLHRIDGRSYEQIEAAIRWCQNDSFWVGNIQSPKKLRAQYDQMRLQAVRGQKQSAVTQALNWIKDIKWDDDKKEIEK